MNDLNTCRICLKRSSRGNLNTIYGNDGTIGTEIYLISGVMIVEVGDSEKSAKICHPCLKQLKNAIGFRKLCIKSNETYRKILSKIEKNLWNKNKISLQSNTQEEQKSEIFIKLEPIKIKDEHDDSQIFEYDQIQQSPAWDFEEAPSSPEPFTEVASVEPLKKERPKKVQKSTKQVNSTKSRNCSVCNKVFAGETYNSYTSHMKRHKNRGDWQGIPCSKCNKVFLSYWSLGGHNKKHHPTVGKLICDVCGKSCANRIRMKRHFKNEHSNNKNPSKPNPHEKMLPCTFCGKFFKSASYLRKHERLHNKLKPSEYFFCDHCGNKFKEKSDMQSHIRFVHIKKRRFHCPKCPGKSWLRKNGLKRHMLNHQNIRAFKCKICQKDFTASYELRIHQRIHTGEHRFECKFCERKFMHQTDCRRHEWGHTGYKGNIKCPNCNQGFFKNSDLQSHLSRCFEQKITDLMSLI